MGIQGAASASSTTNVWNRLRYLKDLDTGKRVSRLNPESEWVVQEVPEMRIIGQEVWNAIKARQQSLAYETSDPGENPLNDRRRPKHLFAGLVKCGCCGGGYEGRQNEDGKAEAAEVFRTLIDQVTLVPDAEDLAIVLRGDLAAILWFAANKKNPDLLSEAGVLCALLSQESWLRGRATTAPIDFRRY